MLTGLFVLGFAQFQRQGTAHAADVFPAAPGRYIKDEATQDYIRFLRSERRQSTKAAADSRVAEALARDIELKTAERVDRVVVPAGPRRESVKTTRVAPRALTY